LTEAALPSALAPIAIKNLQPLGSSVLVTDMEFNERFTSGGIFLPGDDGKAQGVRPRWGKVFAVGPEQTDVSLGQYICIAHGRWSRGIRITDNDGTHTIRKIDPNDILMVSDEPQVDDTMGRPL
jgi:co-chaperonin GroES (HSP10)